MPLFNWSEKFILGIKKIDEEHKVLVDLINKLSDAKQTNKSDEQIDRVFDGLVFYTESHLTNEEFLLYKYKYPEYHSHKSLHDDLIKQTLDLKKKHIEGNRDIPTDLAILLNNWLAEHILVEDKKYAEYFKEKKCAMSVDIDNFNNMCVGIQKIDNGHSKTIELYNSIVKANEAKREEELMGYVKKLLKHWEAHFKYEEDLMEKYGYSGITEHKKEHEDIVKYISNFEEMFFEGFKFIYSSLVSNLNLWIDEHIIHLYSEDKKLAKYLIGKDVI